MCQKRLTRALITFSTNFQWENILDGTRKFQSKISWLKTTKAKNFFADESWTIRLGMSIKKVNIITDGNGCVFPSIWCGSVFYPLLVFSVF